MPTLHVLDASDRLRPDAPAMVWATAIFPGPKEGEQRATLLAHERYEAQQKGLAPSVPVDDLHRVIADYKQKRTVRVPARKRAQQGSRVGHMACGYIRMARTDQNVGSLNASATLTSRLVRPIRTPATIEAKDWRLLRSAAHLWAALHFINTQAYWLADWDRNLRALEGLLVIAENMRRRLEDYVPRNAKVPVLPPGIAWRLPVEVPLIDLVPDQPLRSFERELIDDRRAENRKP